jgi:hypothetical protein
VPRCYHLRVAQLAAPGRMKPHVTLISPQANGGWRVIYEFGRRQRGGLVLTSVQINSPSQAETGYSGRGLTADMTRSLIRPGAARAEFTKARSEWVPRGDPTTKRGWRVEYARPANLRRASVLVTPRPAQPPTRDEHRALVAHVYVRALDDPMPKPRVAVAKEFRWSLKKARDEIHAARAAGMLTTAPRGQNFNAGGGGELTREAQEILHAIRRKQLAARPARARAAKPTRKGRTR